MSLTGQVTGKIVYIQPEQSGTSVTSGKTWKRQTFILESQAGRHTSTIAFDLWNDNLDKWRPRVGDQVTASLEVSSREYQGRYYHDVTAYEVQTLQRAEHNPNQLYQAPEGYAQPTAPAQSYQSAPAQSYQGTPAQSYAQPTAPSPAQSYQSAQPQATNWSNPQTPTTTAPQTQGWEQGVQSDDLPF